MTEIVIYESPDGGKTVYSRTNGSPQRKLHTAPSSIDGEIERVQREAKWLSILKMSERSPALSEAIDKCIVLYELQKSSDDEPLMWHPV